MIKFVVITSVLYVHSQMMLQNVKKVERKTGQRALLRFSERCRYFLDMKGFAGAIFTDLSKTFDCLNHKLHIAKLETYGFNMSALQMVYDCLLNRNSVSR